jgi:hypothetical protein
MSQNKKQPENLLSFTSSQTVRRRGLLLAGEGLKSPPLQQGEGN